MYVNRVDCKSKIHGRASVFAFDCTDVPLKVFSECISLCKKGENTQHIPEAGERENTYTF